MKTNMSAFRRGKAQGRTTVRTVVVVGSERYWQYQGTVYGGSEKCNAANERPTPM